MKVQLFISLTAFLLIFNVGIVKAKVTNKNIYIQPNKVWSADYDCTDSRSGKYESVSSRLISVKPDNNSSDNMHKVQVQVTNSYDHVIGKTSPKLVEQSKNSTKIVIQEGYKDVKRVGFEFRGCSKKAAYAIVDYNGR